ncbi:MULTISPECIES: family 20 glycosylhydrolase [unclassified Carboxylicivirga]|uniref:family 20 glycosylhydrolase n=1 Tax=Carboxylicivirga TaxID=1628153 RepID=UPI003D33A2CE
MRNLIILLLLSSMPLLAQNNIDSLLPVRGFSIAAPQANHLDKFIAFVEKELVPLKINTLILRVDYNYAYESHPELRDETTLSNKDVKRLVAMGKKHSINIVPQINLLGHQSWAEELENLLKVYPQFDETPHIPMPNKYEWPNEHGLYCKSYCPLHPDVHKVVFSLVDELMEAFEATAFHAGLDEVFYIGDDNCPRCSGHDKAVLYANEVTKIRNHLAIKNRKLWMWGDRLIDGKTTGMGMWEASMNNTHRAIDMIPKDIFICDWHYERPDKTAVYFAMKGFKVATCSWNKPDVSAVQVEDMLKFRAESTPAMRDNFQGNILTVWSGAENFIDSYYKSDDNEQRQMLKMFKAL